jgi:hypothetical protein
MGRNPLTFLIWVLSDLLWSIFGLKEGATRG